MIQPALQGDAFRADVAAVRGSGASFHLWWLGQSGFLLHWQGHFCLLDPYLSDSLTRKYAATDKPHVRMSDRVVAPEYLGFVEVVTSSHNHTDHLDSETLLPILEANPAIHVLVPSANREFAAQRLGVKPERLACIDSGESLQLGAFAFYGIPAAHENLEVDATGRHRYLGYVVRFGAWSLYHSGDTILYPGIEDRVLPHQVTVALLPINGRRPERRVSGNLWGREAARLAHDINAKWVIPCHHEMFAFNTETSDEFVAGCRRLQQPHAVLRAGERWSPSERPGETALTTREQGGSWTQPNA
ncbi:MAG: MBL fold metallo-hydrolase [Pedosphaera sp.]|nr:MBL fold metallo-hydrolase [Pedosphaera sp.]